MRKLLKKAVASVLATATITASSVGLSASASGTVNGSLSGFQVSYTYNVDGNYSSATYEGAHYGKSSKMCFTVTSSGSHLVTFGGATYSGCKIKIYNYNTNALVTYVDVPVSTSGMPTLYSYVSLPIGSYFVKVVSKSESSYSTGSFSIDDISGIFYK